MTRPYAGAWIAAAVTVAVFAFLLGGGIGLDMGYRQGTHSLAAEIAVLNERIINLQAAMSIETLASFYGEAHRGKLTASGVPFDPDAMTAASPWLPFGSVWKITRLDNGASVVCTITDRGPDPRLGRGLDLSTAAAAKLGMLKEGVVWVSVEPGI